VKDLLAGLCSRRFQQLSRRDGIDAGSARKTGAARHVDESGAARVRALAVAFGEVV
jgi:hypothetical protein